MTPRRREIFRAIVKGYTDEAIAHSYKISKGTVRKAVDWMLLQMPPENRSRAGLAYYFRAEFELLIADERAEGNRTITAELGPTGKETHRR
jgi:Bacterial regulatory proteins, luxR family